MSANPYLALLARMRADLATYEILSERSRMRGFYHQAYKDEKHIKRLRRAIEDLEAKS